MTTPIELLRAREAELERQMARMLKLIDHVSGSSDALELELQFNRLIGQWRATFVVRDRIVYGPARAGSDRARAIIAAACQQRMDALADEVEDFARCWSSSALIATAFARFRATALVLVAAMATRLDGERRLLGEREVEAPTRLVA